MPRLHLNDKKICHEKIGNQILDRSKSTTSISKSQHPRNGNCKNVTQGVPPCKAEPFRRRSACRPQPLRHRHRSRRTRFRARHRHRSIGQPPFDAIRARLPLHRPGKGPQHRRARHQRLLPGLQPIHPAGRQRHQRHQRRQLPGPARMELQPARHHHGHNQRRRLCVKPVRRLATSYYFDSLPGFTLPRLRHS
jgi:hypothetical protein